MLSTYSELINLCAKSKEIPTNPIGRLGILERTEIATIDPDSWSSGNSLFVPAGAVVMLVETSPKMSAAATMPTWHRRCRGVKVVWGERTCWLDTDYIFLAAPENKLNKKSFTVAGMLYKHREFYKTLVKMKGGIWKNKMSINCDYLIAGSPINSGRLKESSKINKAKKLGKPIISECDFIKMLA